MARVLLFLLTVPLLAQRGTGELRLLVKDQTGAGVEATGHFDSQGNGTRLEFHTKPDGRYTAKDLPFGNYRLLVEHPGFNPFSKIVEIHSEIPLEFGVALGVSPVETAMTITDSDTLLDPQRTSPATSIGASGLRDRSAGRPGRAVLQQVESTPGWLVEANGVLHPRGSEYQTQYVMDGIPVTDNRSPGVSSGVDVEEVASMTVMTGGYPAEYGRKLGGVIEVHTDQSPPPGLHFKGTLEAASFATVAPYLSAQYARGATAFSVSANGEHTDRYLDPPSETNDTNRANDAAMTANFERDFSSADRLRVSFQKRRSGFETPNEQQQQDAGQRQDLASAETSGQISYQHIFSPRWLTSLRAMSRDVSERLWSNVLSTPIEADQDRGFRETYTGASVSGHVGGNEIKFGGEAVLASIRERFGYDITNPDFFDPGVPLQFAFADRRQSREYALFGQDQFHRGNWTFNAGLRWDKYRLLVDENAFSPRLSASWHWPSAGIVFRASYDRAFNTPAVENLLLASSAAAQRLTKDSTGLPVHPSRGNFWQAGFSKSAFGRLRLDGTYFLRNMRNFADDDRFLNTGISFPIAFSSATVRGFEARVEMPRWGRFSGFASYSNLLGIGYLPVTGGLFLDAGSAALLRSRGSFPISQGQRNTISGRVRFEATPRWWLALGYHYGSGLPVELDGGTDRAQLVAEHSARIVDRVDLLRGHLRPAYSMDASAGATLRKREPYTLRLQGDILNFTNRLDVINFASLFSGTAIGPPRTFALRLTAEF